MVYLPLANQNTFKEINDIVNRNIKTFSDNPAVANAFAKDLVQLLQSLTESQSKVTVSLSGGSTPKLLFDVLATEFATAVDWQKIHFFWGDERCVPPTDAESNFGAAESLLLSKIDITPDNIHRVISESAPENARDDYVSQIIDHVTLDENGVPSFDVMILGMGSDGHTASIFPHEIELLKSDRVCEVATHPQTGQKRITVTGPVLNASKRVFFLITGESKAKVLAEIVNQTGDFQSYPTTHIAMPSGSAMYIDEPAGAKLSL